MLIHISIFIYSQQLMEHIQENKCWHSNPRFIFAWYNLFSVTKWGVRKNISMGIVLTKGAGNVVTFVKWKKSTIFSMWNMEFWCPFYILNVWLRLKASVTHSGFLMPSLIGQFPIKICQNSDQDPVIRGGKLLKFVKTFI